MAKKKRRHKPTPTSKPKAAEPSVEELNEMVKATLKGLRQKGFNEVVLVGIRNVRPGDQPLHAPAGASEDWYWCRDGNGTAPQTIGLLKWAAEDMSSKINVQAKEEP